MRTMRIAALLIVAASLAPAVAAADRGTSFHVKRGVYLWHVWVNPPYREAFPSWIDFENRVATLNNLPDGEKSFRALPVGFELFLPPLPGTASEEEVNNLQGQIQTLENKLRNKDQNEQDALKSWKTISLLLLILVIVSTIATVIVIRREKMSTKELRDSEENLRAQIKRLRYFVDIHMLEVEVPENVGTFIHGGNKIYMLKADDINDKPAVIFPRKGTVLVKNIRSQLNEASPEILREIGINPSLNRIYVEQS